MPCYVKTKASLSTEVGALIPFRDEVVWSPFDIAHNAPIYVIHMRRRLELSVV